MTCFKLTLAYDGTEFVGWQRQASGRSVQAVLEEALSQIEAAPVTVIGAGRTDAGVHAIGQVASVSVKDDSLPSFCGARSMPPCRLTCGSWPSNRPLQISMPDSQRKPRRIVTVSSVASSSARSTGILRGT